MFIYREWGERKEKEAKRKARIKREDNILTSDSKTSDEQQKQIVREQNKEENW